MHKLRLVVAKEYLQRVRSRAFVVGTILGPVLITAIILGPALLEEKGGQSTQVIGVIDATGLDVISDLAQETGIDLRDDTARDDSGGALIQLVPYRGFGGDIEAARASLDAQVEAGDLDGYLILYEDFAESGHAAYYGAELSNVLQVKLLKTGLDNVLSRRRLVDLGVPAGEMARLLSGAQLDVRHIGDEESGATEARFILGIALIFALYMMILIYGVHSMNSVIEDKTSRVMEVMLASVTPTELMMGKILGNGLVGLTQFGIWAAFAAGLTRLPTAQLPFNVNFSLLSPELAVSFAVFFLLGYFLYASIYAAVGALCNSLQDAQQFQTPITMSIVIPMILMGMVMRNPDSTASILLSLFPPFTPILMFIRVVVSSPPFWQVGLGVALLALAMLGMMRGAGKLFRLGILSYGKAPSWPQIVRMLRMPE